MRNGEFYGSKYNWQIYLPVVDGTKAKVIYKEEGQKELYNSLEVLSPSSSGSGNTISSIENQQIFSLPMRG